MLPLFSISGLTILWRIQGEMSNKLYQSLNTLFWSFIKEKMDGSYKLESHCLGIVNEVMRENELDLHFLGLLISFI